MNKSSRNRRIYWTAAGLWVLCIYSTLSVVRPVCELLKETIPFGLIVNASVASVLAGLVIYFLLKGYPLSGRALSGLILILSIYGYGLWTIPYPEEKIHFLEYGFLAFLIYRALRIDYSETLVFMSAFLLTAALGWIDEGIQHLLPNRYYQLSDVLLNAVSGMLGLGLIYIFRKDIRP